MRTMKELYVQKREIEKAANENYERVVCTEKGDEKAANENYERVLCTEKGDKKKKNF